MSYFCLLQWPQNVFGHFSGHISKDKDGLNLISGLICSSSLISCLDLCLFFWMKLRSGSQSQTFPLTVYYFWPVDVSCSELNILFGHTCSLLDNSCWLCLLSLAIGWKHIPRGNNKCTLKYNALKWSMSLKVLALISSSALKRSTAKGEFTNKNNLWKKKIRSSKYRSLSHEYN